MRHVHDAVARSDDETAHPGPDGRPETRPGVDARRAARKGAADRLNESPQPPAKRSALNASIYATGGNRDRHDGVVQGIRAVRVHPVDGVVPGVAVEVDAPIVADGVARQEPSLLRVVVAVGAEDQARLSVGVVARLPPEAEHVRRPRTLVAEAVVQVGGGDGPVAARPLGHVAPLVEGVQGVAVPSDVARDQARRPERVDGGDDPAAVELADGVRAVVQVVGHPARVALGGPQATTHQLSVSENELKSL